MPRRRKGPPLPIDAHGRRLLKRFGSLDDVQIPLNVIERIETALAVTELNARQLQALRSIWRYYGARFADLADYENPAPAESPPEIPAEVIERIETALAGIKLNARQLQALLGIWCSYENPAPAEARAKILAKFLERLPAKSRDKIPAEALARILAEARNKAPAKGERARFDSKISNEEYATLAATLGNLNRAVRKVPDAATRRTLEGALHRHAREVMRLAPMPRGKRPQWVTRIAGEMARKLSARYCPEAAILRLPDDVACVAALECARAHGFVTFAIMTSRWAVRQEMRRRARGPDLEAQWLFFGARAFIGEAF